MNKLSYAISVQKTNFESVGQGNWEELIEYISKLGYDGVELAIQNPDKINIDKLETVLLRNNLRLTAIGTGQVYCDLGMCLVADDVFVRKKTIEILKIFIELGHRFKTLVIVGLIRGRLNEQKSAAIAFEHLKESMREVDDYACKLDVNMVIEPINRYETDILNTSEETVKFINDNNLIKTGILLDTYHMNLEEPKWDKAIKTCSGCLGHVHIADSNRWYPGSGHINFNEIFLNLQEIDYSGFYSGEMLPMPKLKTSIKNFYNYMRNINE